MVPRNIKKLEKRVRAAARQKPAKQKYKYPLQEGMCIQHDCGYIDIYYIIVSAHGTKAVYYDCFMCQTRSWITEHVPIRLRSMYARGLEALFCEDYDGNYIYRNGKWVKKVKIRR